MFLACMSNCGAASDLVRVVLQVSIQGLGECLPMVWMGSHTVCLAKNFNVPVLCLPMTSAQQSELSQNFSRRAHCCLTPEHMGCGKLSSDQGPENVLDTHSCFYLIIQISGTMILLTWSQVSLSASRLGAPNQVHSNCLLCSLSPPPKTDALGEQMKP